ncbi:sulfotransferase, partial [bacterium]|nr:sulfotransferase [bacterium]
SRSPIIIGGCGRSGTTLLLSVLSCHPAILGIAPETVALCPDGYGPDGLYNKNPDLSVPFEIQKIYRYLLDVEIDKRARRWCEKTPRNVLYFERILRYFGKQVRIIHIVRDGRDVITSRHPHDPTRFWTTPDRWVQDVQAGLQFENHPQVLTVRYEDLLLEYEKTVRSICRFLDEPFVDEFLDYPESSTVKTHLAWPGGPRAINTSSIAKWKKPEFCDLIESFLQNPEVENLLDYLGYS